REIPRQIRYVALLGIGVDCCARMHREAAADLHALEFRYSRRQCPIECVRLPQPETVLDPVARFHLGCRFFRADSFAFELAVVRIRHRYSSRPFPSRSTIWSRLNLFLTPDSTLHTSFDGSGDR